MHETVYVNLHALKNATRISVYKTLCPTEFQGTVQPLHSNDVLFERFMVMATAPETLKIMVISSSKQDNLVIQGGWSI